MKDYIFDRMMQIADYILKTNATVRTCAKHFNVSKTTVHKDIVQRLSRQNPALFIKVRAVLDENKAQRHIRGGMATQRKYLTLQQSEKKQASSHAADC